MQHYPPHPSPRPVRAQRHYRPDPGALLLAFLGLLMLLMPVSYRAGTETSHVHTIFQGMIDAITGHPHHHHHNANAPGCQALIVTEEPPGSLFGAATLPLNTADHDHPGDSHTTDSPGHETNAALTSCPDTPEILGLSSPIESTSAIDQLGELVALLLSGATCVTFWGRVNRLVDVCFALEPPPPRHA